MARITYVWDKELGELVESSEYYSKKAKKQWSNNHMVINDSIDPFFSHGDCKMYDSKSKYRKMLKEKGFIEVGNEKFKLTSTKDRLKDFINNDTKARKEAIYEAWKRHS